MDPFQVLQTPRVCHLASLFLGDPAVPLHSALYIPDGGEDERITRWMIRRQSRTRRERTSLAERSVHAVFQSKTNPTATRAQIRRALLAIKILMAEKDILAPLKYARQTRWFLLAKESPELLWLLLTNVSRSSPFFVDRFDVAAREYLFEGKLAFPDDKYWHPLLGASVIASILNKADDLESFYEKDASVTRLFVRHISLAAFYENHDVFNFVAKKFPSVAKSADVCHLAMASGNEDVVKFLIKNRYSMDERTCSAAAMHGNIGMLRWLRGESDWVCPWGRSTVGLAAQNQRWRTLLYLTTPGSFPYRDRACPHDGEVCEAIAESGCIEEIHRTRKNGLLRSWTPQSFHIAEAAGHFQVVKWLLENRYPWHPEYAGFSAAAKGHLEILRWLHRGERACPSFYGLPWNEQLCYEAAKGGHVHVLEWLRRKDHKRGPCPWNKNVCSGAAERGNLDVLVWLRKEEDRCEWSSRTCEMAARRGHLHVLRWIRGEQGSHLITGKLICDEICPWDRWVCEAAVEGGHLNVLKWLRSAERTNGPCPWVLESCLSRATELGNVEIATWVREQLDEDVDSPS